MEDRMTASSTLSIHKNDSDTRINAKRKSGVILNVSIARSREIKENFPHFPQNKDVTAGRRESPFRLPASFEDWIAENLFHDSRDAIMASLIIDILCTSIPFTFALYMYPSHLLGAFVFGFTFFTYWQRFILMLHNSEHRKLFKDPYHNVLRYFLSCVMCPFFGIPPGMYRLHHIVMHHLENNVFGKDLSSTDPYQRDNIFHFLIFKK